MDQFRSFFTVLKRKISDGGTRQPAEKRPSPKAVEAEGVDTENTDDGFVLIQREEPKLVAGPAPDPVSSYVSNTLALTQQGEIERGQASGYTSGDAAEPSKDIITHTAHSHRHGHTAHSHGLGHAMGHTAHSHEQAGSAVAPFELHRGLQDRKDLNKLFQELDLSLLKFDWDKYFYDFQFEHSVLQDMSHRAAGGRARTVAGLGVGSLYRKAESGEHIACSETSQYVSSYS